MLTKYLSFLIKKNESGLITPRDTPVLLSNKEVKANIELVHSQIRAKRVKKPLLILRLADYKRSWSSKRKNSVLLAEEIKAFPHW